MTFRIVGHRGAMALEPENTMRSFRRGESLGVDAIELDVHLSRDGHLVVMHDPTLDRTTNGSGAIADTDWSAIAALDAGQGEHVPELAEVWDAITKVQLQIEVKTPAATRAVLDLIRSRPPRGIPTTIASFHVDAAELAVAERDDPSQWRVGLICGKNDREKLESHVDSDLDQLMINWALSELPAAQEYREHRYATVWLCRTREDVERAIDGGWAGTTLDDPRIGLQVRAEHTGRP